MVLGRKRRGFTLVEVACVTLLMGIIMAIALPGFNHARTESRAQTLISQLREIDEAKTQFAMTKNLGPGAPVNDGTDLTPQYLKTWPAGPVIGSYSANAVNINPSFLGHDYIWYSQHCTGVTADAECPL